MSISMRYEDTDKLEVFLGKLETDCKAAGEEISRKSAEVIKARMVDQLSKLKTNTNTRSRSRKDSLNYKHMADDVQIRTVKDEFGGSVVKVQGGKKTGTLWHLVNDGTYRSNATHFMDKGIHEAEAEVEKIIDEGLSKVGG